MSRCKICGGPLEPHERSYCASPRCKREGKRRSYLGRPQSAGRHPTIADDNAKHAAMAMPYPVAPPEHMR